MFINKLSVHQRQRDRAETSADLGYTTVLYCLGNGKRQLGTQEGATRVQENDNENARNEQIQSYQNTQK